MLALVAWTTMTLSARIPPPIAAAVPDLLEDAEQRLNRLDPQREALKQFEAGERKADCDRLTLDYYAVLLRAWEGLMLLDAEMDFDDQAALDPEDEVLMVKAGDRIGRAATTLLRMTETCKLSAPILNRTAEMAYDGATIAYVHNAFKTALERLRTAKTLFRLASAESEEEKLLRDAADTDLLLKRTEAQTTGESFAQLVPAVIVARKGQEHFLHTAAFCRKDLARLVHGRDCPRRSHLPRANTMNTLKWWKACSEKRSRSTVSAPLSNARGACDRPCVGIRDTGVGA